MSARVSAAISALWLFASAQKISIFRLCVSKGAGQRCLLVVHAQPTPFTGGRAELAHGGAGG